MFILIEDTTQTVSLCGLTHDQVNFLEAVLINVAHGARRASFKAMADELLAGTVVATAAMEIDEEITG